MKKFAPGKANFLVHNLSSILLVLVLLLAWPFSVRPAGVTIITHGLNSNVDDWVIAMANRITKYPLFPGTNSTCYELYFIPGSGGSYTMTWRRLSGVAPVDSESGEILIKLDWRQLANNDFSTYQVASAAVTRMLQTNFIPELGGHALAELPLHLIGHSRGGSLVCEMSRQLGTNGIWVDHLTTLDPHPLNNDGFDDFFYSVVDAPARTYENVLFHDNYFQELNVIAYGEPIAGAFTRELVNLDGGYDGLTASHSDVHLWYHGTIDLRTSGSDTVANLSADERADWWTAAEEAGASAGFHYSRIGRGDRLSSARPAGAGTSRISDGYNQRWDFGAGVNDNRVSLSRNNGRWPNVMKINLVGGEETTQGGSNAVHLYYQWAQVLTNQATIAVYLDDDFNPYNGAAGLALTEIVLGTTSNTVNFGTIPIIVPTNATPGWHSLYVCISAKGRSRYLYAPELLNVLAAPPPPPSPPTVAAQPVSRTVVIGGAVSLSVIASGTAPFSFQWRHEDVDIDGATNSVLELTSVTTNDAGQYTLVVTNIVGAATSTVASITLAYPPTIIVQPTNGIVLRGEPFALAIDVSGTEPLSYQWFLRGRRLAGQTGPQLTVAKATTRSKGNYELEVRNDFGVVRTNVFTATVVTPPKIVHSPHSLTAKTGRRATFRVVASGARPLLFQWFKDGDAIENATNRTFKILSVQSTNAGVYSVRVSNIGAVRESAPATLTVIPPP